MQVSLCLIWHSQTLVLFTCSAAVLVIFVRLFVLFKVRAHCSAMPVRFPNKTQLPPEHHGREFLCMTLLQWLNLLQQPHWFSSVFSLNFFLTEKQLFNGWLHSEPKHRATRIFCLSVYMSGWSVLKWWG